jgi:hypothetical protein
VEIQLADNGIGMPESVLEGEGNSLGMELMKGLTTENESDHPVQAERVYGNAVLPLSHPMRINRLNMTNLI